MATKQPKMTISQFMKQLAATKKAFKWELVNEFSAGDMSIRGFVDNAEFCPITAVGYAKFGEKHTVLAAWGIGKRLGLTMDKINRILLAADSIIAVERLTDKKERENRIKDRKQLFKALKLKEN